MFTESYKAQRIALKESFGVPYPESFTDPADEYRALTATAALIDLCHWGALRLTGNDRVRLLNSLTTNDVASLSAGEACHTALATVKGKLVAEFYVLRRENELFVLVAQGDTRVVAETIEKHIIADDVELNDVSDDYGVVAVEGPESRGIVWRLFPRDPLPTERFRFVDADYLGRPVAVVNNTVTGEPGLLLVVPARGIRRIREHLIQSGRNDDMALAGRAAWNMRRVEAGLPWWGSDVVAGENFPKECRLEDVVSYDKGCFLGQETLARMHHRGHPNWLLVGLVPNDETPGDAPRGTEVFSADDPNKAVGRITSSAPSPKLNKNLLMGYVRTAFAEPGTELALGPGGSGATVTVTPLPLK